MYTLYVYIHDTPNMYLPSKTILRKAEETAKKGSFLRYKDHTDSPLGCETGVPAVVIPPDAAVLSSSRPSFPASLPRLAKELVLGFSFMLSLSRIDCVSAEEEAKEKKNATS